MNKFQQNKDQRLDKEQLPLKAKVKEILRIQLAKG